MSTRPLIAAMSAAAIVLCVSAFGATQDDPLLTCLTALAQSPEVSPVKDKLGLGSQDDPTFAMLANQSLATDAEKQAIAALADGRDQCMKQGMLHWQRTYPPQLISLLLDGEDRFTVAALDLYSRKSTFGDFNLMRKQIVAETKRKASEIVAAIRDRQAAEQQAQSAAERQADQQRLQLVAQDEIARRQAGVQLLLNMMRNNQPRPLVPYQMPVTPTVTTNCNRVGDQVTCTSR